MQPFKLSIVLSCQATKFDAATLTGNFEHNLSFLAGLGYEGVELAIRNPDEIDFSKMHELLNKYKLTVPAIGTGQVWAEEKLSFSDPDESIRDHAIRRIIAHIPEASQLKANIIVGLIRGKTQPGVSREQAIDWMVNGLKTSAQTAAAQGVSLCLEPINRYETDLVNTVAEGLDLINQIGMDNLGLLVDTFHMNIEEADIYDSIKKAGHKIFHFHIADSNRWYPGAGHLDFAKILTSLRETGYAGFISGEFLPTPDPETAAERGIKQIKSVNVH